MPARTTTTIRFTKPPLSCLATVGCITLLGCGFLFGGAIGLLDGNLSSPATKKSTSILNKASYDRVYTGMECYELPNIFGRPSDSEGDFSVMDSSSAGYTWLSRLNEGNDLGALITIVCVDGLVVSKTQIGLR